MQRCPPHKTAITPSLACLSEVHWIWPQHSREVYPPLQAWACPASLTVHPQFYWMLPFRVHHIHGAPNAAQQVLTSAIHGLLSSDCCCCSQACWARC